MSSSQVFVGLAVTLALAVACQVVAAKIRVPAIILLLPAGFIAGAFVTSVNPNKLFGATFEPLVSLAVAIILFDGGLDLVLSDLSGDTGVVVRRLLYLGSRSRGLVPHSSLVSCSGCRFRQPSC